MENSEANSGNTVVESQMVVSVVRLLSLALPAIRPVIVDLNCGNGHLLRGASNESTRHLLGCDVEPVSKTDTSSAKFVSVDLTEFYPLLRAANWHADLFVLNPPWRMHWHRERLAALAASELVGRAFAAIEPNSPQGTLDSTIATLMIALDRCTTYGEGFLIANNAKLERLLFADGAPYADLALYGWARVVIPGNPKTWIEGCQSQEDERFETGVLYFARGHSHGPRTIQWPALDFSLETLDLSRCPVPSRTHRLGAAIRNAYATCDETYPCWQIAKEGIDGGIRFHLLDALSGLPLLAPCYTLTLGPGVVRYFTIQDFLTANIEEVIAHLRSLSDNPDINVPQSGVRPVGFLWFEMFVGPIPDKQVGLDLDEIDTLLQGEAWDARLRAHHKVGRFSFTKAVPSWIYCCFHRLLELQEFAFDEFLNAWIKGAFGHEDMVNSYLNSPDHLVTEELVFAKTPFVREKLGTLERVAEEKQTELQMEILRRSKFDCFVYLMEDLRNKAFKIGRSATPGKRESTLQSEVPQIVMRFSIPAEEMHEKQLHDHFQAKRLRGEWFALTNDDLLWIVEFLKASGDASRAVVDYQWLGAIQFASATILPRNR